MPTGYTDGVAHGDIVSFKEYALLCARAFGVCISMRDEPLGVPIPFFEENTCLKGMVESCEKDLRDFLSMNQEEKQVAFQNYVSSGIKRHTKIKEEKITMKYRYVSMLEKAKEFVPPTKDHVEYKQFMIQQLEDSIVWDCDTSYYDAKIDSLKNLSFEKWLDETLEEKYNSLKRNKKSLQEDNDRINSRNNWIAKLKEVLDG